MAIASIKWSQRLFLIRLSALPLVTFAGTQGSVMLIQSRTDPILGSVPSLPESVRLLSILLWGMSIMQALEPLKILPIPLTLRLSCALELKTREALQQHATLSEADVICVGQIMVRTMMVVGT